MSNIKWAEDLRLPKDIRQEFNLLYNDIFELRKMWRFYLTLFSADNLAILQQISSESFQIIQNSLVDSMTMAICRLRDPLKQRDFTNLSLKIFDDPKRFPSASKELGRLENACKDIVDVRNKRVGHASHQVKTDPLKHPIPGITADGVDKILELMEKTINSAYRDLKQQEFGFETSDIRVGDDLVSWLNSHR